jgi:hypothetical protein
VVLLYGGFMGSFRRNHIGVEAVQFTGNDKECLAFCSEGYDPEDTQPSLCIPTIDGFGDPVISKCRVSDWIVKENNCFSVVNDEEFRKNWEPIEVSLSESTALRIAKALERLADIGETQNKDRSEALAISREAAKWGIKKR